MSENNGHKEAVLSRHRPVSYVATLAGLCVLALHPALYPSDTTDATDTGDLTC